MNRHIVSTLTALVAFASLAVAQPGPRGFGMRDGSGPRHQEFMQALNLTADQELQMKNLHIELMKKQTQLRSKIQTLRLENQQAFLAEKVDRSAIEKNVKAIAGVQEQLKLNMVDHWFAVNKMLNADQQKVWKEHAMRFGQNMRDELRPRLRRMYRERFGDDDED